MGLTRIVGIVLIAVGLFVLIFQAIPYTTEKKVFDVGPIEGSVEEKKTIPLSPVVGGLVFAGGIALLILGGRKK